MVGKIWRPTSFPNTAARSTSTISPCLDHIKDRILTDENRICYNLHSNTGVDNFLNSCVNYELRAVSEGMRRLAIDPMFVQRP